MRIDPKGVSECFYGGSTPLGDRLSSENHN
jgi:hypothetical protein